MKKYLQILIVLILAMAFLSAVKLSEISKESIIDAKWFIKDQDSTAIYFKHDNTFWHYIYRTHVDSIMLCRWELIHDRIYLSSYNKDTIAVTQSFKIIFLNDSKLTINNTLTNKIIEYNKK